MRPNRPYKSVSAERTFDTDLRDPAELTGELARVAGLAWARIERSEVRGRTVTLKVKFADFTLITRSKTYPGPVTDRDAFTTAGQALLEALLPLPKGVRLLGLGIHSIVDEEIDGPMQLGLAI